MKQLAQYPDGRVELANVPMPVAPPGGILVRTTHSVVSPGTERAIVEQARKNILQKARERPDHVRKVLDTARTQGWRKAFERVQNKLQTPAPLGYSAAGVVESVDSLNTRFRIGDRVAVGGAECAFHAEYLAIPDLLAAPVPPNVPNEHAAFTTMAAIAMQGVRQADARLGEFAVVLGQGLVGLLATNLLAVSGVRVMAVDLLAARRDLSRQLGAERFHSPADGELSDAVREWTGGRGADVVLICTATNSSEPVETAGRALRDRGRLVIVGVSRVELSRDLFYGKELDVRFSRSYGPGRYDPTYEWGGVDYPLAYVRWTEQRHFEACLHLMSEGRLRTDVLAQRRVPLAESVAVYDELAAGRAGEVGIVLEYEPMARQAGTAASVSIGSPVASSTPTAPIGTLDVIGAGRFAREMLLPHLRGRIAFGTVVNATPLSAAHAREKFGFAAAESDAAKLWDLPDDRAVLIATRHHLHAPLALAALARGRHIFLEKPLCLAPEELSALDAAVAKGGSLMVGFNRRFAPATRALLEGLRPIEGPRTVVYRVAPGRVDPGHWYANPAESGGRVIGECCHFFDWCAFVIGRKPVRVFAQTIGPVTARLPLPDSVAAQVEFEDGSCAQIVYAGDAAVSFPKETITVFAPGFAAEIENFQRLEIWGAKSSKDWNFEGKGHAEEMAAWLEFLAGRAPHPLPYADARASTALVFAALQSVREGVAVSIER